MTNFKVKKKVKTKKKSPRQSTLDNKHKNKMLQLTLEDQKIDKFKKELNKINKDIDKLKINSSTLEKRSKLLQRKKDLLDFISDIESQKEQINYFDVAGDIINQYYQINKDEDDENIQTKSIIDYLNPTKNKKNKENNNKNTKASLYKDFCKITEGINMDKMNSTDRMIYCIDCKVEKILDSAESAFICPKCGHVEFVIIDEDRTIKEYSPYKRINHFKEWLNQFQAKETTEITDEVYYNICNEINRHRITDINDLNRNRMQNILKKLGYNHLYEHIPYIINKLSNLPPPKIDKNTENTFIKMFIKIQEPWEIFKPKDRKNFLSYSYILYKFSELLELDHLLDFFPLLKTPQRLMEQDEIWKKFCKHLRWEFYPTKR